MAYTKGPWRVAPDPIDSQEYNVLIVMSDKYETWIARAEHNWNSAGFGEHRISWKEAQDNASLMAAAPQMFEALDAAYAELAGDSTRDGPRCLLLTKIEKAMAAAKGI